MVSFPQVSPPEHCAHPSLALIQVILMFNRRTAIRMICSVCLLWLQMALDVTRQSSEFYNFSPIQNIPLQGTLKSVSTCISLSHLFRNIAHGDEDSELTVELHLYLCY